MFKLKLISAKQFKDFHIQKSNSTALKSKYMQHLQQAVFWGAYIENLINEANHTASLPSVYSDINFLN